MSKQQKYRILNLENENVTNTTEAIKAAGLDWQVNTGKMQGECFDPVRMENVWQPLSNHKCVYRKDTGKPLGQSIVGKDFQLIQNDEAFSCFEEVFQKQQLSFISGGWYHDGGSVFLQAKFPSEVRFNNGDNLERHLLMAQGHTGQQSLIYSFTHIKPNCANTLQAALRDSTYRFTLKHTTNIRDRIDQGIKFMQEGLEHLGNVERKMQTMSRLNLSNQEQINYLKLCYDRPIDEELKDWRNWQKLEPIFEQPRGWETSKGTLWNAYNVLTEYEDHHTRINRTKGEPELSEETIKQSRQVRALFGTNTVNRKVRGFKIANDVLTGNLDLRTGKSRDTEARKRWAATVAGLAGAVTVQSLLTM